ncbi:MAG: Fic family protein [Cyanobacteria bacterium REEB67]|nr:Fic family protein [Cyanobacteria bacterium REEB67]
MDKANFSAKSSGRLHLAETNAWAFVPNPLPPIIQIDWELASLIADATGKVAELAGIARTLPNPHLLIKPFIRREAVLSSRIEGTQASLSDLLAFEGVEKAPDSQSADLIEVVNYVDAMEHGLSSLATTPLCLRTIKEMHSILIEGTRGDGLRTGDFRTVQNYIGQPGCTIRTARYVPPPVPEMIGLLTQLERFIHEPTNLPPLVKFALIHYQFESIHPFLDGNGRVGRLLTTLLLCSEGLLPQPLLYLSAFFEHHRREYYDLMLDVSQNGAWEEWVLFFLRGIVQQSKDAVSRSRKLQDLRQAYQDKFVTARTNLPVRFIDYLFFSPFTSVGRAAEYLEITPRAVQKNIDKLAEEGVLEEVTGRQRNRVFRASEIMSILDADFTFD